jgi:hypothetical protein
MVGGFRVDLNRGLACEEKGRVVGVPGREHVNPSEPCPSSPCAFQKQSPKDWEHKSESSHISPPLPQSWS